MLCVKKIDFGNKKRIHCHHIANEIHRKWPVPVTIVSFSLMIAIHLFPDVIEKLLRSFPFNDMTECLNSKTAEML